MKTKLKPRSRILEAVHETASDLHRLGLVDKRKIQRYEVLCLEPLQGHPDGEYPDSPFKPEDSPSTNANALATRRYGA